MTKQEIQKVLDYITLQIGRAQEDMYECDRGYDYGRGHAKFALQEWLRDLQSEYTLYAKALELSIRGE